MPLIKQPYRNLGFEEDGILYGSGDAKRKGIKDATFLCVLSMSQRIEPEDYKFYKIIDDKPVEVPQTRNFYTGKRRIDPKYYVAKDVK